MTDVVGLPLSAAKERLEAEGYSVITRAIRSRKGVDGDDVRVVQQKITENGCVQVTVSTFLTDVDNC